MKGADEEQQMKEVVNEFINGATEQCRENRAPLKKKDFVCELVMVKGAAWKMERTKGEQDREMGRRETERERRLRRKAWN